MHFKYFNVLSLLLICLMSTSQVGVASASTDEEDEWIREEVGFLCDRVGSVIGSFLPAFVTTPCEVVDERVKKDKAARDDLETKIYRHTSLQNQAAIRVKLGSVSKGTTEIKKLVKEGRKNDEKILTELIFTKESLKEIKKLDKELRDIARDSIEIMEDTNQYAKQQAESNELFLSEYRSNQSETQQIVEKVHLGVQINTAKLQNLETISMSNKVNIEYLKNRELSREFTELSDKQQLQALKTTKKYDFLFSKEEDKQMAISNLDIAVRVDNIKSFSRGVTRIAGQVSKLADILGLESESKAIKDVNKVFDLGANLRVGMVSANPVGILDAVISIADYFFGGGGGKSKSRYELIQENQQKILGDLEQVKKGLVKLEEQNARNTKVILERQQEILQEIKDSRETIVRNIQTTVSILKEVSEPKQRLDNDCERVLSKREASDDYSGCIQGLEGVWNATPDERYNVSTYIKVSSKNNRDWIGNPLVQRVVVQRVVDGSRNANNLDLIGIMASIIKLTIPARALESIKDTRNINYKSAVSNIICGSKKCSKYKPQKRGKNAISLINQFETLLHPKDLITYLKYLIAVGSDLDKAKEKDNSVKLEAIFNRALQSLNMAIAQQALLSGDSQIPYIADQIFRTPSSKEDRKKALILLENNSILATNVLLFEVDRQLRLKRDLPERSVRGKNFRTSLDIENSFENWLNNLERYDALYMRSEFGDKTCSPEDKQPDWGCVLSWNSKWPVSSDKRPYVKLSYEEGKKKRTFEFPLPSAERLQSRALQHTKNLQDLLEIRQKLFDVADNLNPACNLDTTSIFWSFPDSIFDETRHGGSYCSN